MNKRRKTIILLAVLLVIISGNFYRISSTINIRAVDFLSILAIGALTGLLINQVIILMKKDK